MWRLAILCLALFTLATGVDGAEFRCGGPPIRKSTDTLAKSNGDGAVGECYWGPCDNPAIRDHNIPDSQTPIKYVRIHFHVMRDDDGNYPTRSELQIAQIVAGMNEAFLPWRFQFTYDWRYANSSKYRSVVGWTEFAGIKELLAINHETHCNVYFAFLNVDGNDASWAIYAQEDRSTTKQGGIIMHPNQLANFGDFVPSHEMGHALGLFHTFSGVSEQTQCSNCSEIVGSPVRDHVPDYCSDTEPAPLNFNCSYPSAVDICSGLPFEQKLDENFMGYSFVCDHSFTPQQAGRMHCWLATRNPGWIASATFDGTNTFGSAPVTAEFSSLSSFEIDYWEWDFGDGGTSELEAPTYTYTSPGLYSVSIGANTALETFSDTKEEYVWVHADTIVIDKVVAEVGGQVKVNLLMRNYVPIQVLEIPISWVGPLNMTLDSVSAVGLRTETLPEVEIGHIQASTQKALILLNGLSEREILPGSGGVVSLHFSIPIGADPGINAIVVAPYYGSDLSAITRRGTFRPESIDGWITSDANVCCLGRVGNANGLGDDEPTIGDVSVMIDAKFITGICDGAVSCLTEADVNQSGGSNPTCDDVTIGDISILIDYLFITGSSLGLADCI